MRRIDQEQEKNHEFFEHYAVANKQELIEKVKSDPIFTLQLVEDLLAEKFGTPRNIVGDTTGDLTIAHAKKHGYKEEAQPAAPSAAELPAEENGEKPKSKNRNKD